MRYLKLGDYAVYSFVLLRCSDLFFLALQYAEKTLVDEGPSNTLNRLGGALATTSGGDNTAISLSDAFTHFLGLEEKEAAALINYEKSGNMFHSEQWYKTGDSIFESGTNADGFFVVLSGSVVILDNKPGAGGNAILSGAGIQPINTRSMLSGQKSRVMTVGSVFGFVDYVLKRPRTFSVVAGKDSLVAKCHRSGLEELKREDPELDRIVDKVLLLCSVVELATRDP